MVTKTRKGKTQKAMRYEFSIRKTSVLQYIQAEPT